MAGWAFLGEETEQCGFFPYFFFFNEVVKYDGVKKDV